ncbi:MAG: MerR family transcriptional regulator [Mesorhizobium sp.]|uniref:MerR family transcriptional regulator n=1 Tax=Mesorhizobium sp. TaxID=1871066 RepID=UPI000FE7FEC9|nr:helix-turn-helix domain-containing protein [Mesorhizobium sp.]RWA75267.1 MAG: MerR family transcriptional regulator [Mesorhizobium sp.]
MRGVAIGEASRRSGVKIPTIRYYEQIGLLPSPDRTENQRRVYAEADLSRLAFIRHARELGFDVEAIRTLIALQDDPHQSCAAADETARARLAEVDRRITSLQALRKELLRMIANGCDGRVENCRVIDTLSQPHQHGPLA